MSTDKFQDAPAERPYETCRRVNGRGYTLIAIDAVLFGQHYQGVSIQGPNSGFFPNLLGIGTEALPLYVIKAAERLALEQFSPSTQLPEEVPSDV